jgi:hypothetical protein
MQLLNNQLKKNANATDAQVKQNDKFIESLSNQVGIVDDNLRPAMGKLVRATGSVGQAQKLLKLALDASVVSGKPLDTVAQALSKAYNGNTTALTRMFPELKKSKNALADLRKEVEGAAAQQADPFQKFNVAMDNLKEKLGYVILPYLTDFIDKMMKPGGAIDQVGQFLDDVSNPKTDAGQTFLQIKDAVSQTVKGIGDFFALFGNGDAVKGFANIATALIKALPALLALKGIMMLASAGKAIQSLVTAVTLIRGGGAGGNTPAAVTGGKGSLGIIRSAGALAIGTEALLAGSEALNATAAVRDQINYSGAYAALQRKGITDPRALRAISQQDLRKQFPLGASSANNITINVHSADPKATVDAVSQYIKQNGGKMPSSWGR